MTEPKRRGAVENTSRIEDSGWDTAVLGPSGARIADAPALSLESVLQSAALSPLAQALIQHRLTENQLAAAPSPSAIAASTGGLFSPRLRHRNGLRETETLSTPAFTWLPIGALPLAELNQSFANRIAVAIETQLDHWQLTPKQSRRVAYLLFHPLQNITQHAVSSQHARAEPFGGLALKVTEVPEPQTPSLKEYIAFARSRARTPGPFLELIIHDDGEGIAQHFARHQLQMQGISNHDLQGVDHSREWNYLKSAFERHTSSKYFIATVDQRDDDIAFRPGIGLAAMIAAVRALNVYLEVRAGRLRAYRWFKPEEKLIRDNLIHPDIPPAACPYLRGTLIRMLLPLESNGP